MNLFAVSGLLIGISSLIFGTLVFVKNPKNRINQFWGMVCLSVAYWGFGGMKIGLIPQGEKELALFWFRVAYIGVILIPTIFYHFVHTWLELQKRTVLYLFYLFSFFFLILEWTPWADLYYGISNMTFLFSSFYWIFPITPLYTFFLFCWFTIVVYAHYELYKALKKSSGAKYNQIKYFLLASAIGFGGGGTCFLPCFGINLYPVFNFGVVLYPPIMAYAIVKYRLMDILWALGRTSIYVLSLITTLLYGLLFFFLNQKLGVVSPLIFNIFIIITIIPIFLYLFRFYKKVAAKYFYYTFYSFQIILQNLGKQLNQIIELDELTALINRSLLDALRLDRVGIILKDSKTQTFKAQEMIIFSTKDILSLLTKEGNFSTQYLSQTKKPFIREEIPFLTEEVKSEEEKRKFNILKEAMNNIGVGLLLPLLIKKELIGLIVLGDKLSGEAYTKQDIDLLITLSSQASVAFNNALSYEEIKKRKADLEKFYKLTVGRELKMIELKKKIKELEGKTKEEKS